VNRYVSRVRPFKTLGSIAVQEHSLRL